jgi:hypothetical protein
VNYSPPGAPGLNVTYRFQGQFTAADPPTPWHVTGTLTTSGAGLPDCSVQYDATGQAAPTPSTSATAPSDHTNTYIATWGMANSDGAPGGLVGHDCAIAGFLDRPFAITVRVHDDGSGRGEVTVVGNGWNDGNIASRSPLPTRDLRDSVSSSGSFRVGGSRTYDNSLLEGDFTASWSGGVGGSRTRPAEFPLTIHQTWHRDRDFVSWLIGSGGPEDYNCSYDVRAVRQA